MLILHPNAENFMTGYRIVFDREKMVLGWTPSDCEYRYYLNTGCIFLGSNMVCILKWFLSVSRAHFLTSVCCPRLWCRKLQHCTSRATAPQCSSSHINCDARSHTRWWKWFSYPQSYSLFSCKWFTQLELISHAHYLWSLFLFLALLFFISYPWGIFRPSYLVLGFCILFEGLAGPNFLKYLALVWTLIWHGFLSSPTCIFRGV